MEELAARLDRGAETLEFRLAGVDLIPSPASVPSMERVAQ
jgi:hypothetical protein